MANTIEAAHPDKPRPDVTALAKARNDIMVIPTATGDQLVRAVLALEPAGGMHLLRHLQGAHDDSCCLRQPQAKR